MKTALALPDLLEKGMAISRSLNIPGFVPSTAEESQAIIERARKEEGLRCAGLLS